MSVFGSTLGAVLLALAMVVVASLPASAQELPPPRVRMVKGSGTYTGTLHGERSYKTYSGDKVVEKIDCSISMTFQPGGEVSWESGDYQYEKTYMKQTTRGEMRAITRIKSDASRSDPLRPTRSTLILRVTDDTPPLVQRANWGPVEVAAQRELWVAPPGQPLRLQGPPATLTVYCEPYIRWRGADGKGRGLPLASSYNGPDGMIAKGWVRYLRGPGDPQGEDGPPRELQRPSGGPPPRGSLHAAAKYEFRESTKVTVVWRLAF